MKAKKRNPRLKLIALVTYAVGNPGRLEFDGLSVNSGQVSDHLIKVVRAQGKRLYAWTVDEPRQMVRLIERGVGGIVTNAPEELVRIRRERANLTDFEAGFWPRAIYSGSTRLTEVGADGAQTHTRPEGLGRTASCVIP